MVGGPAEAHAGFRIYIGAITTDFIQTLGPESINQFHPGFEYSMISFRSALSDYELEHA